MTVFSVRTIAKKQRKTINQPWGIQQPNTADFDPFLIIAALHFCRGTSEGAVFGVQD